ncbi:LysR family transcriptional regulator [Actinoplanes sp. NPDC020271]|uniref:LysR family transcriptional regulator n=1 Tax=Actinoplanes sp. NPDC020271 TaxID=3363896 RepID=UPI0037BB23D2
MPLNGVNADVVGAAIPPAILLPGNGSVRSKSAQNFFGWGLKSSRPLEVLASFDVDVLRAVCALADYIDEHGSPIDYERRRAIFTDVVLSRTQWEDICFRAEEHPGRDQKISYARRFVFQLLTGADLRDPSHSLAFTSITDKSLYLQRFEQNLSSSLRMRLREFAMMLLSRQGIDEPLTWSPPPDCVAGLRVPGRLGDVAPSAIEDAIRKRNKSISAVAKEYGITAEHARYLLLQTDVPTKPPIKWTPSLSRQRADVILTRDFFELEHSKGGKSLLTLIAETRLPKYLIVEKASALGFDVCRTPGQSEKHRRLKELPMIIKSILEMDPAAVDLLAWFQKCVEYPSFSAAEAALGCGEGGLGQRMRKLEALAKEPLFRVSAKGARSSKLTAAGELLAVAAQRTEVVGFVRAYSRVPASSLERPAALGDSLIDRVQEMILKSRRSVIGLQRFSACVNHATLRDAAQELGLTLGRLSGQISRLERTLCVRLFERARAGRPLMLTEQGDELRTWLLGQDLNRLGSR